MSAPGMFLLHYDDVHVQSGSKRQEVQSMAIHCITKYETLFEVAQSNIGLLAAKKEQHLHKPWFLSTLLGSVFPALLAKEGSACCDNHAYHRKPRVS